MDCVNVVLGTSVTHLSISDVAILPHQNTNVTQTPKTKSFTVARAIVRSFFLSQEAVYNYFFNLPVESVAIAQTSIIHRTCPNQSPIGQQEVSFHALSNSVFSRTVANTYMMSLQYLDLGINSLVYNGLSCVWPPNVTNMNLSSNRLTDLVLNCLPKGLQMQDLQNNQVSTVLSKVLKLEKLLSLNLNSNRLRDLPGSIGFPILRKLLLINSLHAPSVTKLESCPKVKADVSDNSFASTCALRSFKRLQPSKHYCNYPEAVGDSAMEDTCILGVSCNGGLLAAAILWPRSVFVLSGHFVKSGLCHYELHQHHSSDSIVLVLVEPLPRYLIQSKYYQLKMMMSRHTYLEWPRKAKHRLFWANLALKADLPNAPITEQEE
ncbi:LOW QUALITY PROTEIN: toll-like receptor 1 [Aulostomus maculatus]